MPSKTGTEARERLLSGSRPSYGKGLSGGRTDVSVWERAITLILPLKGLQSYPYFLSGSDGCLSVSGYTDTHRMHRYTAHAMQV